MKVNVPAPAEVTRASTTPVVGDASAVETAGSELTALPKPERRAVSL